MRLFMKLAGGKGCSAFFRGDSRGEGEGAI
jgi:hypothetical protein